MEETTLNSITSAEEKGRREGEKKKPGRGGGRGLFIPWAESSLTLVPFRIRVQRVLLAQRKREWQGRAMLESQKKSRGVGRKGLCC